MTSVALWRRPWAAPLLISLVLLVLYGASLSGGFILDDWGWLSATKRNGVMGLYENWRSTHLFFRPGVSFVFGLLFKAFGANPLPFRVFNLGLQLVTALAVRKIWLELDPNRNEAIALGCALLFACWPMHAETVIWIAGMTDGLAVAIGLWGLVAYLRWVNGAQKLSLILAFALFSAALFTKEAVLPLPLCAILLGAASPFRTPRKVWKMAAVLIGALLLIGAYVVLRSHELGTLVGGYKGDIHPASMLRSMFGLRMVTLLAHAFAPYSGRIHLHYGFGAVEWALSLLLMGSVACLLFTLPKKSPSRQGAIGASLLLLEALAIILLAPDLRFLVVAIGLQPVSLIPMVLGLGWIGWRYGSKIVGWLGKASTARPEFFLALASCVAAYCYFNAGESVLRASYLELYALQVFLVRPVSNESRHERKTYRYVAVASFVCAFMALAPAANLASGIDGQQMRFSYFATSFSVLAIVAMVSFWVREARSWAFLTGIVCFAAVLGVPHIQSWAQDAMVWSRARKTIEAASPADTVYVLSAPGELGSSAAFLGWLEDVPYVARNDSKTRVRLLSTWMNLQPNDRMSAQRLASKVFEVDLVSPTGLRFAEPDLQAHFPLYVKGRNRMWKAVIAIPELKDGDRVMVITESDAILLK